MCASVLKTLIVLKALWSPTHIPRAVLPGPLVLQLAGHFHLTRTVRSCVESLVGAGWWAVLSLPCEASG